MQNICNQKLDNRYINNHNNCNQTKIPVKIQRWSDYKKRSVQGFQVDYNGVTDIRLTLPPYTSIKLAKYMKQLFLGTEQQTVLICDF